MNGNVKKALLGAAFGTLISSIALTLYPKRNQILKALEEQKDLLSEKAKKTAKNFIEENIPQLKKQNKQKYFWSGSAFGLITGASAAALVLSSKLGDNFKNQLFKIFKKVSKEFKDFDFEHRKTNFPRRTKSASRSRSRSRTLRIQPSAMRKILKRHQVKKSRRSRTY